MTTLKIFKEDFYDRLGGLKQFENLKVLDLGCGDGEDSLAIAKFAKSVVGIDIAKNSDWKKRERKNLKFVLGKGEKLPFGANTFNGLFLKDVIHHVEDMEKTLKEIKRVTTKDALIILIEGNRYNPLFYVHMTKIHGHEHLSQNKFKQLVLKYFPKSQFIHFESHFIPGVSEAVFEKIVLIEKLMSKINFLKPILSYNVARINYKG